MARAMQAAGGLASTTACLANNSRSQYQEDQLLLPLLLQTSAPRSFVELGALDGERFSNTWLLEKCFGFNGLLIEANPSNFRALRSSRRNATMRHSAVCDRDGGSVRVTTAGGATAGQTALMSKRFIQTWGHRNAATTAVPCAPLRSLMAGAGLQHGATLLSLDVEGAEALVLRTVDPAAFQVVLVEMDGQTRAKDEKVHRLLTAAKLVHRADLNAPNSRVYVQPELEGAFIFRPHI